MPTPTPKEVFDNPQDHWEFLKTPSDVEFEAQHFERKESGSVEDVLTVVSAFANENREGGLLVLGISRAGKVKGINHLSDDKRNRLTNLNQMLVGHSARARLFDCTDETGKANRLVLIYVPYSEYHICETPGNAPQGWLRRGSQNNCMNDVQREQLKRDKRIVDFEQSYCCPFDPADLDEGVAEEFRRVYLADSAYQKSDEELLYHLGALGKDQSGYFFTNAGFLFFAANPQRMLPAAHIRLLRFEVATDKIKERGLPTYERNFGGCITQQIREVRTFFKETGFFKNYPSRKPEGGGFVEEPELPHIAVDEAIVNAVAHRNYAVTTPIECESYKDAFIVVNGGRVLQRDRDVPEKFTLDETTLVSTPRNPKLIEWLRLMKDEHGAAFVWALGEGTKRMRDEMAKLELPPPEYEITEAQTKVTLFNNAAEREARFLAESKPESPGFANLFPVTFTLPTGQKADPKRMFLRHNDFMVSLSDALSAKGWYIDHAKFGRIIAHRRGSDINIPAPAAKILALYPAYSFQLRSYWDQYYLCIDYTLEVKNVLTLLRLLRAYKAPDLVGRPAIANWKGWRRGRIVATDGETCRFYFSDFEREEELGLEKVVPNLPKFMIKQMLGQSGVNFDLDRAIKKESIALEPGAARIRAAKTQGAATTLADSVFPLQFDGMKAVLDPKPVPLPTHAVSSRGFRIYALAEPTVEFNHHQEAANIRDGITKFGSYDFTPKTIELVPFCTPNLREKMAELINRLKVGQYKYHGSERTFSTRMTYNSIITVPSAERILEECKRLVDEHPEWGGDESLNRLFLVHTPEAGYASDDEQSPYYLVKKYLLENGVPCQMVDTPTLLDPNWKDLNLALNIIAKCGVTPWVLPDVIPDADFFVGLSYTSSGRRGSERLMGYANVFNQYGRWMFYSGSTSTFAYEEKAEYYRSLMKNTLERLRLSETPSIYFHYSAKFSEEDRAAILEAAKSVRPQGVYSFVWINTHHSVRLYDRRPETDGSLSRGSYIIGSPNQIYLSTTGYNPYRKTLGTPLMLEISIRTERPEGMADPPPDLKALAVQILSLTKLNWASTDSLCGEPITTKYAGDIAYLTSAFLRQAESFRLHKVLEKTPWFI